MHFKYVNYIVDMRPEIFNPNFGVFLCNIYKTDNKLVTNGLYLIFSLFKYKCVNETENIFI